MSAFLSTFVSSFPRSATEADEIGIDEPGVERVERVPTLARQQADPGRAGRAVEEVGRTVVVVPPPADNGPLVGVRRVVDLGQRKREPVEGDVTDVADVPAVVAGAVAASALRTAVGGAVVIVDRPTLSGRAVDKLLRVQLAVPARLHVAAGTATLVVVALGR